MKRETYKIFYNEYSDYPVCLVYFLTKNYNINSFAVEINDTDITLLKKEKDDDFLTWFVFKDKESMTYNIPKNIPENIKEIGLYVIQNTNIILSDFTKKRIKNNQTKLKDIKKLIDK